VSEPPDIIKPQLTPKEQIEHLRKKGVKFNYISEEDALDYLSQNNNYFKLRAYRKSFEKYVGGKKDGTYIDLDFAMLKDLAIIDMRLRYTLLLMSLDIEHFEKVKLLKYISESADDGYNIVNCYLSELKKIDDDKSNDKTPYASLMNEIHRNKDSEYCGGIISKYDGNYPVWAFVEIIPFGSFINFLRFCADYFNENSFKNDFFLLKDVKRIRNVAAHNNCLIYNLKPNTTKYRTNNRVNKFLSDKKFGISKSSRQHKLSNSALNDMVTLIFAHISIVQSIGILKARGDKLKDVISRCYKNIDYYKNNNIILSAFEFLKKVVDNSYEL
jgi:hypothetical protein